MGFIDLEKAELEVTSGLNDPYVVVRAHRCRNAWCPRCNLAWAMAYRARLLHRYARLGIKSVGHLTITLDERTVPGSVTEKLRLIRKRRVLYRIMQGIGEELGRPDLKWAAFVEFGDERQRLHYHILIDGLYFIEDVGARFQPITQRWAGTCNYNYREVEHIGSYVTTYVTSDPNLPAELLDFERVPRVIPCKGYWGLESHERENAPERGRGRSIRDRLASCGQGVELFIAQQDLVVEHDDEGHEQQATVIRHRHIGAEKFNVADLVAVLEREGLSYGKDEKDGRLRSVGLLSSSLGRVMPELRALASGSRLGGSPRVPRSGGGGPPAVRLERTTVLSHLAELIHG